MCKVRISVNVGANGSEITLPLAILHGCFTAFVIVSVPSLGLPGRSHLLDDLLQTRSLRQDSTCTGRIAYGPEPHYPRLQLFILLPVHKIGISQPDSTAVEHPAFMG